MPAITLWQLPSKQMILILYKNFRDKVPIIILILTTSKANHNSHFIYIELSNIELGNKNDMDSVQKSVTNSLNDFGQSSFNSF